MKHTKKALLMSALSLLLCLSMLVGTTFAWFTDSATTNVNKIQSGTLDVDLVDANGDSLEGKPLEFVKAEGAEDEDILWEPGCTYELPAVYVVNNGNLHLKYQIIITGIAGDAKLNEAIEWYINGTAIADFNKEGTLAPTAKSEALVIKGHMKEEAGNEFQNLSIDGISITVLATQQTAEHDSTDDQYDANAYYYTVDEEAKTVLIENLGGLIAFRNAVNGGNDFCGYTVKLNADIDMKNMIWEPIGEGSGSALFNFDGQGHTISNLYVPQSADTNSDKLIVGGLFGWFGGYNGTTATPELFIKNLNINNAYINVVEEGKEGFGGALVGYIETVDSVTIENVNVTNATVLGNRVGGVAGFANGMATVTGNSVAKSSVTAFATSYDNGSSGEVVGYAVEGATVSNNTVDNVNTEAPEVVGTAEDLKAAIEAALGSSDNATISLSSNIVVDSWQAFELGGYNGVANVTILGNGYSISGLNQPLLSGSFAGNGQIRIDGLTIKDANIKGNRFNNLGLGAFLAYSDASGGVILNDCHLVNSTVECLDGYAGGLVGYTSSTATVTGCSVTGSTIIGGNSTGAIAGQFGAPATVSDCTVTGNTIKYANGNEVNTDGWRVGVVVGTANVGTVALSNITENNNTLSQGTVMAPEHSNLYGRSLGEGITLDGTTI